MVQSPYTRWREVHLWCDEQRASRTGRGRFLRVFGFEQGLTHRKSLSFKNLYLGGRGVVPGWLRLLVSPQVRISGFVSFKPLLRLWARLVEACLGFVVSLSVPLPCLGLVSQGK